MKTLSVAVLTYNEEKNIADCLESVRWADEIVVLDEKSSDKTAEIARQYTKKVFFVDHGSQTGKTHDTMFHKHKQAAIDKCSGDWILQLDADERVSKELAGNITQMMSADEEYAGYRVPRKNIIFGKWVEHAGWYPDYQVKLFKNGKGRYPCKTVHEDIEINGETGTLESDLIHCHYTSVEKFVDRLNRYTTNDANFIWGKGERVIWSDAIRFPFDEFVRRFFYWEGYKDGLHGLVLSCLQAMSRLVVFAKLWEKQGFEQYGGENFLSEAVNQSKKIFSDWRYWLMMTETNPVKRFALKIKYKFRKLFP